MKIYQRPESRVRVTLPDYYTEPKDIREPKASVRAGSAASSDAAEDLHPAQILLGGKEFELLDSFEIASIPAAAFRATTFGTERPVGIFNVALEEDEEAIVLTEEDGLFQWHLPITKVGSGAGMADSGASFKIDLGPRSSVGSRATVSFVGVFSKVKAYVLKFVAKKIADFAMVKLEKKIKEGVVWINSNDPESWVPTSPGKIKMRETTGTAKILLLVHGTFSSTRGSFNGLARHQGGNRFLDGILNHYDLIIGYDHRTLSKTPEENAKDILDILKKTIKTRKATIDGIAYSRGGLVFRSLTELLWPGRTGYRFARVIHVGCTNEGTELANPENWQMLINIYTNLILAGARLAGGPVGQTAGEVVKVLGLLMKHIVKTAIEDRKVPGLAAMYPLSDFIKKINRREELNEEVEGLVWNAVTSNYEPGKDGSLPERVQHWLADLAIDQLMHHVPNDLVVNTSSMTSIDNGGGAASEDMSHGMTFPYTPKDSVAHTCYFNQEQTANFLGTCLEIPGIERVSAATLGKDREKKELYDVRPDRVDLRDWLYRPVLRSLPNVLVNIDRVPVILDQGREGACTGFALAAVINYLLKERDLNWRVSPYMLYNLARRHDEWPGEEYDGSSARGAMKAWVAHGACKYGLWPSMGGRLDKMVADDGSQSPGGAYYRVSHRNIRDMHAALNETGILFATLRVHDGWNNPQDTIAIDYACSGNMISRQLTVIRRDGDASNGHAIAIVGYTGEGFVIQNSWGPDWGTDGFALLPYDDYLIHAMDVWVAQLGVPVKVQDDLYGQDAVSKAGSYRAAKQIPLAAIRPYIINIGNNGKLSDTGSYWTTPDDVRELFQVTIGDKTRKWRKKRILLYVHGGLNSEEDVAKRVVAMGNTFLENEVYPLHVMWETGPKETILSIIEDQFTKSDERAGSVADWMAKFRDHLTEARDETLEMTLGRTGRALWREMKENARLASITPQGAVATVMSAANRVLDSMSKEDREQWELHIVAHSAGSIFIAHAMPLLCGLNLPVRSIQLLAPAITVELFKASFLPAIQAKFLPVPTIYILDDTAERDDSVYIYGKSLLYLVSNAFEERREMPLLGMEKFLKGPELEKLFAEELSTLIIANRTGTSDLLSTSRTHGGFDNDRVTMNEVLHRILGKKGVGFTDKMLAY